MKVLLTEQDVLEHCYGVKPQPVNLGEESNSVQSPELVPVDDPVPTEKSVASPPPIAEASNAADNSSEPQTLETLVTSLKDQYSARELQNKLQELNIEASGNKTDLAVSLAKAILASQS